MKLFAITPDTISIEHLIAQLPEIQNRGATHLYVRLSASIRELGLLMKAAAAAGIVPVVPYAIYKRHKQLDCGLHYTSSELSLISHSLPARPRVITASAHCSAEAQFALRSGADYVYASPVFEPLSKHGERQLFPHAELRSLIGLHGERIVLLGGMTTERLKALAEDFRCDFSAAGITLFFNGVSG
jgi:hypothetical protein